MIVPAGFEEFFVEAGQSPDAPEQAPPDLDKLLEIAQRHDLEVPLPLGS